jgi:N-acyl-phosphatidylethanolamine-hydrolysing phospholipase D
MLQRLKHVFRGLLFALLTLCSFHAASKSKNGFEGAPRDEGGRFTNLVGTIDHGGVGTRVAFMLRRFGTYFRSDEGAPQRIGNDGSLLGDSVHPTVTWVGHATLLIQLGGVNFLTDPIWSDRPSPIPFVGPQRFVEPGIALEDLPPIDFVFISHNHFDHLDVPTLKSLYERDAATTFYVPLGNGALLNDAGITNVVELDWGDSIIHGDVLVHCLPSQHWSKRSLNDDRKSLWSSWAVTSEKGRFFFAGDTGYFDGFKEIGKRLGPFDLAALPIGAYEPRKMMHASHMNPEEAVQAALDLGARKAMAMHFGTFDLSDEPLHEPPERFKQAASDLQFTVDAAWILKVGETRLFGPDR